MTIGNILYLGAVIISGSYTCWIAYYVTHQEERKKRLKRYKKEKGDVAYRLYEKVLTRQYLEASLLFCVGLVLILASDILSTIYGFTSIVLTLWVLSMICTLVSVSKMLEIFKGGNR